MSLLTCRKIAVLKFTVFVLHEQKPKAAGAHLTSSEKASSVPGRTHTAVVESSGAANPRVPVLKFTVLSLSPNVAKPPPFPSTRTGTEFQSRKTLRAVARPGGPGPVSDHCHAELRRNQEYSGGGERTRGATLVSDGGPG